ncbi:MAG: prolyl oligopeptidase family serine peptidase [Chloroflexota bacterium]
MEASPSSSMAPRRPVVDTYHGVNLVDDYRWLEGRSDPEVRAWSDAQNMEARAYLDALPSLPMLRARIRRLLGTSVRYTPTGWHGGLLFAYKFQPPLQQVLLVAIADVDDPSTERVVVDPNPLDPSGATAIDWFVPSHDGRLVAVSLSEGGSEDGTLHVFDVQSGEETAERIPKVQYGTAGGSVAWLEGSRSVLYTRYPRDGERDPADMHLYQQVWRHELGSPVESDTYEVGREFPKIGEIEMESSEDGRHVFTRVAHGDGGDCETWLRQPDGSWRQLSTVEGQVVGGMFGAGALWLRSLAGAPNGKLLRISLDGTLASAVTAVPESNGSIATWAVTPNRIYVARMKGGPSRLEAYDGDGRPIGMPQGAGVSAIRSLVGLEGDEVFFSRAGYMEPEAFYRWEAGSGEPRVTSMRVTSDADFSGVEVIRDEAISKDGTRVPITILRPRDVALDGSNPTLLYGYGGYSLSLEPSFSPTLLSWIEQGAVYAIAHIRGGGEFGDAWHRAGNLTRKQNVFDDFIACAERLIETGYTQAERLAIMGASNGGLLMGAVMTQRPELFRAVACDVGVLDSLRVELDDNGIFNVTEFGTVTDPEHFRALLAYSPYANVRDGVAYPAVLLSTGANDPRVDPYHSRKMTARLQAATSSGRPILLRTTDKAGHGMGSGIDETVALKADQYAFLLDQLGTTVRAPG